MTDCQAKVVFTPVLTELPATPGPGTFEDISIDDTVQNGSTIISSPGLRTLAWANEIKDGVCAKDPDPAEPCKYQLGFALNGSADNHSLTVTGVGCTPTGSGNAFFFKGSLACGAPDCVLTCEVANLATGVVVERVTVTLSCSGCTD